MKRLNEMLVIINNSQQILSLETSCKKSLMCIKVLKLLINLGLIRGFFILGGQIKILLKYNKNTPCIKEIKLISNLGHFVFFTFSNLLKIKNYQFKIFILFTSYGIKTLNEALYLGIGGKLMFIIK